MRVLRSFALWCVALVAVGVFAASAAPSAPAAAQRIAHLESMVRCPACEDLSVAQSNATSSLAVRAEIERAVHDGRSDAAILASLEAAYGSAILLSPPAKGLGVLLWAVPVSLVVVLGLVVARLWRRR